MSKKPKTKRSFKEIQAALVASQIPDKTPSVFLPDPPEGKQYFEWAFDKKYSFIKNKSLSWVKADFPKFLFTTLKKLNHYTKMTWGQLTACAQQYHYHQVEESDLDASVLSFLKSKGATDGDLCQIKIDDKHRVIGVKKGTVFYLVCNDENHVTYK